MEQNPFIDRLTTLLGDAAGVSIYPCIDDLVANGIQLSRFSPSDEIPNRQDVTQYLAAMEQRHAAVVPVTAAGLQAGWLPS